MVYIQKQLYTPHCRASMLLLGQTPHSLRRVLSTGVPPLTHGSSTNSWQIINTVRSSDTKSSECPPQFTIHLYECVTSYGLLVQQWRWGLCSTWRTPQMAADWRQGCITITSLDISIRLHHRYIIGYLYTITSPLHITEQFCIITAYYYITIKSLLCCHHIV